MCAIRGGEEGQPSLGRGPHLIAHAPISRICHRPVSVDSDVAPTVRIELRRGVTRDDRRLPPENGALMKVAENALQERQTVKIRNARKYLQQGKSGKGSVGVEVRSLHGLGHLGSIRRQACNAPPHATIVHTGCRMREVWAMDTDPPVARVA